MHVRANLARINAVNGDGNAKRRLWVWLWRFTGDTAAGGDGRTDGRTWLGGVGRIGGCYVSFGVFIDGC